MTLKFFVWKLAIVVTYGGSFFHHNKRADKKCDSYMTFDTVDTKNFPTIVRRQIGLLKRVNLPLYIVVYTLSYHQCATDVHRSAENKLEGFRELKPPTRL